MKCTSAFQVVFIFFAVVLETSGGAKENGDATYKAVRQFMSFDDAYSFCVRSGWFLVSVADNDQYANLTKFGRKNFRPGGLYWIGLYSMTSTKWNWVDNSSLFEKYRWAYGYPTGVEEEQCGAADPTTGELRDFNCAVRFQFVCDRTTSARQLLTERGTLLSRDQYLLSAEHNIWYKKKTTQLTGIDLEKECVSEGAHLASIHSQGKEEFLNGLFVGKAYWIGMMVHAKSYVVYWEDKSHVNYTHFSEPAEFWTSDQHKGKGLCTYVEASGKRGKRGKRLWQNTNCNNTYLGICERPAGLPRN